MTGPLYAIGRFCSRHHWPDDRRLDRRSRSPSSSIGQAAGEQDQRKPDPARHRLDRWRPNCSKTTCPNRPTAATRWSSKRRPAKLTEPEVRAGDRRNGQAAGSAARRQLGDQPAQPAGRRRFLSKDQHDRLHPGRPRRRPGRNRPKSRRKRSSTPREPAEAAGLETSVGGYVGQQLSKPDTEVSEAIGLAAAMIILLFAFGTATAMMLPIVSAIIGLACSLSIIRLLEHVLEVPSVAATLATMIGLGVGIDYALFIVTRHKLQLGEGMELRESIARATATAGGAVVFAGFTVVIALCSLAFAGIPLVSTLGFTAAIAVVVAVCAAATLLPAMLGALGPRINSLRVQLGKTPPRRQRAARLAALGATASPTGPGARRSPRSSSWSSWRCRSSSSSSARTTSAPCPRTRPRARPTTGSTKGFGPGVNGPLLIASEFDSPAGSANRCCRACRKRSAAPATSPRVSEPTPRQDGHGRGLHGDLEIGAVGGRDRQPRRRPARRRRSRRRCRGPRRSSYVGGQTAGYIDLATQIADKLPLMIAIVVALSFIVLLLAFRSLLVPIKAAAMNLLSVAAAYGVVTAVFQLGWGSSLIGLDHSIPIVSFVPLLMFAILFGLSMDYEVFLLTQMREHYHRERRREARR